VAAQGDAGVNELRAIVADDRDERLPIDARASVIVLAAQLEALQTLIGSIEKRIKMQHRSNETSQRVETIPGIGVLGATAIVATAADPTVFRSGRDFAAWTAGARGVRLLLRCCGHGLSLVAVAI
jgi:transposase